MDAFFLLKVLGALLLVCGLFGIALMIIRKINPSYFKLNTFNNTKLKLQEQIVFNSKQRLVVLSYEDRKYILLLGNTELLIDKIKKSS